MITEIDETNNQKSIILYTSVVEEETIIESDAEPSEATSNETAGAAPPADDESGMPPGLIEDLPANIPVNALDELSEAFGDDLPAWQEIFGNKWIIIGVAVIGGAGILVLLMLRKRSQAF